MAPNLCQLARANEGGAELTCKRQTAIGLQGSRVRRDFGRKTAPSLMLASQFFGGDRRKSGGDRIDRANAALLLRISLARTVRSVDVRANHAGVGMRTSWSGFRTVLCAIDFSEPSRRALRHAAVVAARAHGRLIALFVNDPLLVGAAAVARPRLDLCAQSGRELDRLVRTTLGKNAPTRVERRIATGEPADQILSVARDVRADLIVVGSHGLTGIARLTFGSTTTAVLKRTPVPVLVVPAYGGTGRRVASGPRPRPARRRCRRDRRRREACTDSVPVLPCPRQWRPR